MTDSRIPERYLVDRRVVRLTDTQRSSYFMSTLWSVSNRTDGYIDQADLQFIPTFNANAVDALISCGLWEATGTGWTDVEFLKVQTSKDDLEVLDNARRADREKKARLRAHKAGNHELCTPATCSDGVSPTFSPSPRDVPRELSPGGHRRGEEGQATYNETGWFTEDDSSEPTDRCSSCGTVLPASGICSICRVVNRSTGEISDSTSSSADWPVVEIPKSDSTSSSGALSCMKHGTGCDVQGDDCEWSYE